MPKRLSPEAPMILSVAAQFLAVAAALWVIWPLKLGPIYYSERSIVETDGLGVLPMLFAPSALILAGTFSLYLWATRGSSMARWAAWAASALLLIVSLGTATGAGLFFLPAAVTLLTGTVLQGRIYPGNSSSAS